MGRIFLLVIGYLAILTGIQSPVTEARQVYSGNDLLKNCENLQVCDTYFAGLLDSYISIVNWAQIPHSFCVPGPSTGHLLWPLVGSDLMSITNQRYLKGSSDSLVLLALSRRYPCEPGQPALAEPAFLSGLDLINLCQDPGLCEAFIIGVLGAHQTLVDLGELGSPFLCIPEAAENQELMIYLLTYLGGHPDQLNYTGAGLTILALSEYYVCAP